MEQWANWSLIGERKALADIPNALGYQRLVESETNGYLVRQYLYSSLYDRMSTRPFLEDIEKKWLTFQLLCGLRDCHAKEVFHGDIKTENTLVTSWNWLYLSDFSSSFKPTTLPEDNPADFSYYFDTAGRRTCYLAPERFMAAGEKPDPNAEITWAMDVFSAGCVIAELFLESPIFNLSQLYKYKKGEYDPKLTVLDQITDKEVRDLVAHMIQVDPEKRYSAEHYLNFWRQKVFPDYFYSFLHQYMALVTDPSSGRAPVSGATTNLGEADDRIDRVYYDFDKISYFLGYENEKERTKKPKAPSSGLELFPVHLQIPNNEHEVSISSKRPTDDGTLIFLTLVVSSLRSTARAMARVRACDILLAFGERVTDEAKVDRVLPYLVNLLNDEADIVKVAAIRTLTQLMALVTVISPVNANVFPEYILKRTRDFLEGNGNSALVRANYAACLGSLATTTSRVLDMVTTLRADGSLPTSDPEAEDGGNNVTAFHGLFDNAREELVELFATHTKALITDTDSSVRRALLGSVPELCMFFGTADANDVILSHLNTYLNDRDWMLKCAFFETIVGVATFLGGTSLEEFIMPLMVQALTDPEEFVVERVLRSFANMAELGLFQRSKTWELVDIVARFTMHPNIWIREAATMFLSSSTTFLSSADKRCIILPLIRPYLKTEVKDFSEISLLDALKRPLPRPVLDLALTWASTKVDRGVFWKHESQVRTFSFGSTNYLIPTSIAKDSSQNGLKQVPRNNEDEQWISKLRNIGMAPEDEFKLLALRGYIWRVAPSRQREKSIPHPEYLNAVINLRNFGIMPQTVMFDDPRGLDEPLRPIKSQVTGDQGRTIADALLDASTTIDDSLSKRRRSGVNNHRARIDSRNSGMLGMTGGVEERRRTSMSPSPIASLGEQVSTDTDLKSRRQPSSATKNGSRTANLSDDDAASVAGTITSVSSQRANREIHKSSAITLMNRKDTGRSFAETSTDSTNAFGRVEGPFTLTANQPAALAIAQDQDPNSQANGKLRAVHTYSGNDPSILQMLDSMYVDNYPNDMIEFGPLVTPITRRKTINRSSVQAADKPWRPEGILVATFAEHVGPVNRISVAPDHVFFITGGDDGAVKVWDTARLERNIAHRSRQTHKHKPGAKVTSLCFVENTHCFVSTGSDGSINVVKVDYVYSGGVATGRYGKLRQLREYQLPDGEFAVWSDHFKLETNSVLIIATNQSRVLAIDLRAMQLLYTLDNPVHHGAPTCFVTDRKRHWLLLGTSHGVLDLWDLRFRVRLKAWGVPGATAIHRLCIHPFKGRGRWVCVAGGSGQNEITVWDIERTQCREVYRAGSSRDGSKTYDPWPVDEDRPEGMLGRFATALEPTGSSSSDRGVRAMVAGTDAHEDGKDSKYGFLVAGGGDKKIRFWDLAHAENSIIVSGLDVEESKPVFTSSHPTAALTLNAEKAPRSASVAPDAGNGTTASSKSSGTASKNASGRPPRSTVISLQQQNLLKSHLDSILDIALLESPYGMTVSVDRSGCTYVFQ